EPKAPRGRRTLYWRYNSRRKIGAVSSPPTSVSWRKQLLATLARQGSRKHGLVAKSRSAARGQNGWWRRAPGGWAWQRFTSGRSGCNGRLHGSHHEIDPIRIQPRRDD